MGPNIDLQFIFYLQVLFVPDILTCSETDQYTVSIWTSSIYECNLLHENSKLRVILAVYHR